MEPDHRNTGDATRRREAGKRLTRLSFAAYGFATVLGLLFGPTAVIDDLWGEQVQVVEVLVPLSWLVGVGLNICAIRRGATAAGVWGLAASLLVPLVFFAAFFVAYGL